jgi:hypothetical protein
VLIPANIHTEPFDRLDDARLQQLFEECERAAQAWLSPAQLGPEDPEERAAYWLGRTEEVLAEIRRRARGIRNPPPPPPPGIVTVHPHRMRR